MPRAVPHRRCSGRNFSPDQMHVAWAICGPRARTRGAAVVLASRISNSPWRPVCKAHGMTLAASARRRALVWRAWRRVRVRADGAIVPSEQPPSPLTQPQQRDPDAEEDSSGRVSVGGVATIPALSADGRTGADAACVRDDSEDDDEGVYLFRGLESDAVRRASNVLRLVSHDAREIHAGCSSAISTCLSLLGEDTTSVPHRAEGGGGEPVSGAQ